MLKAITTLLLLTATITAGAQDARQQADRLNDRAEADAHKLNTQTLLDSVAYYRLVVSTVSLTLQCDEQDRKPNKKGTVKLRHEKDNRQRIAQWRPLLIDAGMTFVHHRQRDEGVAAWQLYLRSALSPLAEGQADESGIAAYYIAQTELASRSYKAADRYADIALRYDETAQQAAEVKAQCMAATMANAEDSLRYLAVLTQLYRTDPTNPEYFSWVMQFYAHPSPQHNLTQFVDQQLEDNPGSYVPWVLKGEIAMNAKRWDEAVDAYQQADQLRPDIVPIIYNIGVCLNNKVLEMQKAGNKAGTDNLLAQARNYLERVRAKDPQQQKVSWAAPLYMAYRLLGDKVHADELEPIVQGFKEN